MMLVSPLALLFGLTALVPLVLHLYQRRQRTVVEFSTTRFFTESVTRSQRRLRLRRLLLLLLRMSACVVLGLALAQPILSLAGCGGGAGGRDVVILLDDSLSMQAREDIEPAGGGTRTRFERGKELAVRTIERLVSGDRAAVITFTGRTPGVQGPRGVDWSHDLADLADRVAQLEPSAAAGDAHQAMKQAAALFEESVRRRRLALIISDFQESDWRQTQWPQPAHPIAASVLAVGRPTERNVVADQMVLGQGTSVVNQPNLLRVRLINYQRQTVRAGLVVRVDDKEVVRRDVELAGQSPHIEPIPLTFSTSGQRVVSLEVDARDALPADNRLYDVVRVSPRLSVLVVDGATESGRQRSGAFFLRTALMAVNAEGESVQSDVIPPAGLDGVKLEAYRVVVLSDVKELSLSQVGRLERFVQSGGGLAVIVGQQIDERFYNEGIGGVTRPLGGLMPAEIRSVVTREGGLPPLHIVDADMEHPILQRFKGELRGALAGVNIRKALAVKPREAWVIASMEDDLPFLLERRYGRGRVILLTTATHPTWTNLPRRRLFIPLMSRTISYLASGGTVQGSHEVGVELVLRGADFGVGKPLKLVRPDGSRVEASMKVAGGEPVPYLSGDLVDEPGIYRVDQADGSLPAGAGGSGIVLAVNAPRRESVPNVVDFDAFERLSGQWRLRKTGAGSSVSAGPEPGAAQEVIADLLSGGSISRGIWDVLLWVVLVLIVIEPLIANRRVGSARAGQRQQATGPMRLRKAG